MARAFSSWLSGPGATEPDRPTGYPGQELGLPEAGAGSLAPIGRRLLALVVDWLVAYGLAGLGMPFGIVTPAVLPTAVLLVWFALGTAAVRLFGFTPGQYALRLTVVPTDRRRHVGTGRAAARAALIALVLPALFLDADGRGLQDRLTFTAVVRR
jgi:hypothetical protein